MGKVLILGNGFDLDLGFKTKYKDFLESKYFPSSEDSIHGGLIEHIRQASQIKQWFDLENEIKNYAMNNQGKDSSTLKEEFNCLSQKLNEYLKSLPYNTYEASSCAYKLLKVLIESQSLEIFNFNYTPFKDIFFDVIKPNISIKHVHGTINDDNIIIGIEDEVEIPEAFCFLLKSHNKHYRSVNLGESLFKNDDVIFFGHSLGLTDYYYFSNFFLTQSGNIRSENIVKKKITIVTYNYESAENILLQLRKMNNKSTLRLFENNDLRIYCTKEKDSVTQFNSYLGELRDDIKKENLELAKMKKKSGIRYR